jgi:uncharacterized phage-associated protein
MEFKWRCRLANAGDVAAAVLEIAEGTGVDTRITAKKLQKLVYYSQAWSLADQGAPLFSEPIEAWSQGPVVRSLWSIHSGIFSVRKVKFGNAEKLTVGERRIVEEVVDRYGRLTAERLSELTHSETPWRSAREGVPASARSRNEIRIEAMRSAYQRGRISPEKAVDLAIADNHLEGMQTSPDDIPHLLAIARNQTSAEKVIRERLSELLP